jgi:hypothetical protein
LDIARNSCIPFVLPSNPGFCAPCLLLGYVSLPTSTAGRDLITQYIDASTRIHALCVPGGWWSVSCVVTLTVADLHALGLHDSQTPETDSQLKLLERGYEIIQGRPMPSVVSPVFAAVPLPFISSPPPGRATCGASARQGSADATPKSSTPNPSGDDVEATLSGV